MPRKAAPPAAPLAVAPADATTRAKVERVIADLGVTLTAQEVERVLAELDHVPENAPPGEAGGPLAVAFDETDRALLPPVIEGIADVCGPARPILLLPMAGLGAADLAALIGRHRPDGLLLLPGLADMKGLAAACNKASCRHALITVTGKAGGMRFATHDRAAAGAAIDRLVALGHRRIGFVSGPEHSATARERELGYLDALADHGLDRGAALIAQGDLGFESGRQAALLLLEISPRPTAILAVTEAMATGVLHAALAKGIKVPDALSVIGFGDEGRAAQAWPPLSTVDVPYREIAAAAIRSLMGLGMGGIEPELEPRLTPRATLAQVKG